MAVAILVSSRSQPPDFSYLSNHPELFRQGALIEPTHCKTGRKKKGAVFEKVRVALVRVCVSGA
jgi:hypothetical protein